MSLENNTGDERTPLLSQRFQDAGRQRGPSHHNVIGDEETDNPNNEPIYVSLSENDEANARDWGKWRKRVNVASIMLLAVLATMASSIFTPGVEKIGQSLGAPVQAVNGILTAFVFALGAGPPLLAPLSETFGRRPLYLICFGIFSLLQIPTALIRHLPTMIVLRFLAGFSGSVAVANGGGSISDLYEARERATILGWYLVAPLMGPALGPVFGGLIFERLDWPWVFWILAGVCSAVTTLCYFTIEETYAPAILTSRCKKLSLETGEPHTFDGRDSRSVFTKVLTNTQRPIRLLFGQPIVFTMACFQAAIFASMYTLFSNMQVMYGDSSPYGLSTQQVGLLNLGIALGFLLSVTFIVPQIGRIFILLSDSRRFGDGTQKPEYRLPVASVGAVLLVVAIFWFAWTVQRTHFLVSVAATVLFGFSLVAIFNSVQNYWIDAFEQYAASAIAAGAIVRSFVGSVVPLFSEPLFGKLGYAWGWSVFGFISILFLPAPLLFMRYGEFLRRRFETKL